MEELYLTNKQIKMSIERLSKDINSFCYSKGFNEVITLTIMNGGLIFAGHLIPNLNMNCKMDYCQVSRYGDNEEGSEFVTWKIYPQQNLKDKVVLIIDDIFDEGLTLKAVYDYVKSNGGIPLITVLFDKKKLRKVNLNVDFVGTVIEDKFVFGFGLDLQGYKRNLPDLWFKK